MMSLNVKHVRPCKDCREKVGQVNKFMQKNASKILANISSGSVHTNRKKNKKIANVKKFMFTII